MKTPTSKYTTFCFKLLSFGGDLICSNGKLMHAGRHLKPNIRRASVYKPLRVSKCKKVPF